MSSETLRASSMHSSSLSSYWSSESTRLGASLGSSTTGAMAHYDIFRHGLAMMFPAYGHALWEPGPGNLYPAAVAVGDVGYIRQEYHEQLTLNMENHIEIGKLSPHNFCSAGVTSGTGSDPWAKGPQEEGEVSFSCPNHQGAVLCLPIQAKGEDTVASADFGKWIIKHIDRWFGWARQLGLGIDRMEDIVLVTGTHCARSWTNVAFPGWQEDAQASFRAKVDHNGDTVTLNWQSSHERNRGVVLNYGPDGENLPEDQCIFIRGFRVARKLKILPPRLKGAAGPNPDPEGYDEEPDAELMSIPTVPEYRDPLHILLEYIAELLLALTAIWFLFMMMTWHGFMTVVHYTVSDQMRC
ncbi:hypothetical protein EDB92DRAFT_688194 [Lactarius akahatsu]|uniref:Uncharacterized protein n=1 Tax=Lactarius akahatsu TaxID=416441 RepID=A0AAD4LGZ7_9AGAM|nr:hypothetical protein EDB92DRAFT_688194 [Lactarius akahatsu]